MPLGEEAGFWVRHEFSLLLLPRAVEQSPPLSLFPHLGTVLTCPFSLTVLSIFCVKEHCKEFYKSKLLLLTWRHISIGTEYKYKCKESKERLWGYFRSADWNLNQIFHLYIYLHSLKCLATDTWANKRLRLDYNGAESSGLLHELENLKGGNSQTPLCEAAPYTQVSNSHRLGTRFQNIPRSFPTS